MEEQKIKMTEEQANQGGGEYAFMAFCRWWLSPYIDLAMPPLLPVVLAGETPGSITLHQGEIMNDVILHAFDWHYDDIAALQNTERNSMMQFKQRQQNGPFYYLLNLSIYVLLCMDLKCLKSK